MLQLVSQWKAPSLLNSAAPFESRADRSEGKALTVGGLWKIWMVVAA
jgi:hypothetical protein